MTELSGTLRELMRTALGSSPVRPGVDTKELEATETRLRFPLPDPLREFYATVGRLPAAMASYHSFVPPASLRPTQGTLVVCHEHQRESGWGISVSDLQTADPPVWYGVPSRLDWHPQPQACSLFLVNMACWQLLNAMPSLASAALASGTIAAMREHTRVVGASFGSDMVSFVNEARGVLGTALLGGDRLYLAARSDTALEQMESVLDVELDWG